MRTNQPITPKKSLDIEMSEIYNIFSTEREVLLRPQRVVLSICRTCDYQTTGSSMFITGRCDRCYSVNLRCEVRMG